VIALIRSSSLIGSPKQQLDGGVSFLLPLLAQRGPDSCDYGSGGRDLCWRSLARLRGQSNMAGRRRYAEAIFIFFVKKRIGGDKLYPVCSSGG